MDDIRKLSSSLPNIVHLDVGKKLNVNARGSAQAGPVTNFEEWLEVLDTLSELRALHGVKFFYEVSSINLLPPSSANNPNLSTPSSSAAATHVSGSGSHSAHAVDSAVAAKTHSQMSLMDRSRIKKNDWTASMLVWRCPRLRRVDHWDEGSSRIIALTRASPTDAGGDAVEAASKESNKVRWEVRRLKAQ
ncbi:hypothetical protein NMY22_g8764 [Coprinellus aureogranulatus]|nr:hypothetical protein NMY22_g8764 [Coprinellus aureogranulatus]